MNIRLFNYQRWFRQFTRNRLQRHSKIEIGRKFTAVDLFDLIYILETFYCGIKNNAGAVGYYL